MTKPSCWPSWIDDVWAKSSDSDTPGESLAEHTWYVLVNLARLIRARPTLGAALGQPSLWHCAFWACWLHDVGKTAPGFQSALRGGPSWPYRHEVLSLAFIDWLTPALTEQECTWIAAGIASHHRDADETGNSHSSLWLSPNDNFLAALFAEIPERTLSGVWQWISDCSASWIAGLGLEESAVRSPILLGKDIAIEQLITNGGQRALHWLRTYITFAEGLKRNGDGQAIVASILLRGYITSCDHAASAHVTEFPSLIKYSPRTVVRSVEEKVGRLYDHQQQCTAADGSALLVAPTGSGKTEAALLWSCVAPADHQGTGRIFYSLPYQASMNAMYDRLSGTFFPDLVGLEHSRSTLALYCRLLDGTDREEAARLARWQRNLARLHYFPIRVLSPYQILKAFFRIKGYEALLADALDASIILDEIHVYDPRRLAMILGAVKYLRQHFGARFLIMSATMPSIIKSRLADALGNFSIITATPELFANFSRHQLFVEDGDLLMESSLRQISELAASGTSVLVCCNTVHRAQEAYRELQRRARSQVEIVLLHGRFNGKDRLAKEAIVRAAAGSISGQRRPVLLVATQVVEVSLDIDLDVMYSDPAPLEALVQRAGRVNRRRTKGLAPIHIFRQPRDGQGVYQDGLIAAALSVLEQNNFQPLDEASISDWLDKIYSGEIADAWNKEYDEMASEFESIVSSLRAFYSDDRLEDLFYRAFDGVEVLPLCLEQEFRQAEAEDPLRASQFLVPIRWRQLAQLRSVGRVLRSQRGWPPVVDAAYDSELGLRL